MFICLCSSVLFMLNPDPHSQNRPGSRRVHIRHIFITSSLFQFFIFSAVILSFKWQTKGSWKILFNFFRSFAFSTTLTFWRDWRRNPRRIKTSPARNKYFCRSHAPGDDKIVSSETTMAAKNKVRGSVSDLEQATTSVNERILKVRQHSQNSQKRDHHFIAPF